MSYLNGLYSHDCGILAFAGTAVYFPSGEIIVEADKANYSFPYKSWFWFVDEAAARAALNLPDLDAPAYVGGVPAQVSAFQAKAQISAIGLYDTINGHFQSLPANDIGRIAWENASEFRRHSPTVLAIAQAFGLTYTQLDQMFISASTLSA
jgi:hypothetical protein